MPRHGKYPDEMRERAVHRVRPGSQTDVSSLADGGPLTVFTNYAHGAPHMIDTHRLDLQVVVVSILEPGTVRSAQSDYKLFGF